MELKMGSFINQYQHFLTIDQIYFELKLMLMFESHLFCDLMRYIYISFSCKVSNIWQSVPPETTSIIHVIKRNKKMKQIQGQG
jgi:hypothetical protein